MIPSVYKKDFHDPEQITQLEGLLKHEEQNSKGHKNSICGNFLIHKCRTGSEIDFSWLGKEQKKCVAAAEKLPWSSSKKIIGRCQNDDNVLWKWEPAMNDVFSELLTTSADGVTMEQTPKALINVS